MSEADKIIESLKKSGRKVEEFYTGNKGSDKNVGSIEKISQTSDKNVANIEDDIKTLIEENPSYKKEQAIEHILAELEQKDKRIKELEEERQLVGIPVRNKRDGNIGIVLHQWENGSIAVLERINPRIINTHDSWNTLEIITDEVKQVQTNSDSISKQKIKNEFEKIQLLYEKNLKEVDLKELQKIDKKIFEGIRLEAQRDFARELLQESEDK